MIEIKNDFNTKLWDKFLNTQINSNFFQSPAGYEFYSKVDNIEPIKLFVIDENNNIEGVLIAHIQFEGRSLKKYLSTRCIIEGGPIINENSNNKKEILSLLLKSLHRHTSAIYYEFRNYFDMNIYKDVFHSLGYIFEEHLNYIIHLENKDDTMAKVNSTKRRQIRKSIKTGAKVIEANSINQVEEFYNILKTLYAKKVKKPLPNWKFFKTFYEGENYGKYLLIEYRNNIVGGIMCPIHKDTISELYIAGKDREIKNVYPSVLATWAPLEFGIDNSLKFFDFLGAGKPSEDYGVRNFKEQFGGDLKEDGRFLRINKPLFYSLGKLYLQLKSKL